MSLSELCLGGMCERRASLDEWPSLPNWSSVTTCGGCQVLPWAYRADLEDVRKHPGADRLQLANVRLGASAYQVVVGLDARTGDQGVYFLDGARLPERFCEANSLIGTRDASGNRTGGLFDGRRRVVTISLRGERSEGFWVPLSYFEHLPPETQFELHERRSGGSLPVSDSGLTYVDEAHEHEAACKYVSRATKAARTAGAQTHSQAQDWSARERGVLTLLFPEHRSTAHFRMAASSIPRGASIEITEKLHGTSGRYALLAVPRLTSVGRLALRWNDKVANAHRWLRWARLPLSRSPVMERHIGTRHALVGSPDVTRASGGFYGPGSDAFRVSVFAGAWEHLALGEIVYGEIVGFQPSGKRIQKQHSPKSALPKATRKEPGCSSWADLDTMNYSYGNGPTACALHVYRISRHTERGLVEYPASVMRNRAEAIGLRAVPPFALISEYDGDTEALARLVEELANEHPSALDKRHLREGVVVRWDHFDAECGHTWGVMKQKSFYFSVLEGHATVADETEGADAEPDMEDAS